MLVGMFHKWTTEIDGVDEVGPSDPDFVGIYMSLSSSGRTPRVNSRMFVSSFGAG